MKTKLSPFRYAFVGLLAGILQQTPVQAYDNTSCCKEPCQSANTTNASDSDDASVQGDPEERPRPVAPPVIFSSPPPTGEIAGARNSLTLPSLRISLPKLTFETPECSWGGFSRGKRAPQMNIDSASAPMSHNNPLLFGHIPTSPSQNTGASNAPQSTPDSDNRPASEPATQEGCGAIRYRSKSGVRSELAAENTGRQRRFENSYAPSRGEMADPWENTEHATMQKCQRDMVELTEQLTNLQNAVLKLAEAQQAANQQPSKPSQKSRLVDPWDDSHADSTVNVASDIVNEQARRIAFLETRIEELSRERATLNNPVQPEAATEVHKDKAAAGNGSQSPKSLRPSILGRMSGMITKR